MFLPTRRFSWVENDNDIVLYILIFLLEEEEDQECEESVDDGDDVETDETRSEDTEEDNKEDSTEDDTDKDIGDYGQGEQEEVENFSSVNDADFQVGNPPTPAHTHPTLNWYR